MEFTEKNVSRGVHYNEATRKYDYTQYDLYTNGNGYGITNNYNYSSDSLKRLNEIQLVSDNLATHVTNTLFTKSIEYDDDVVIQGNATNRIYSITYSFNNRSFSYCYCYDANNNLEIIAKETGDAVEAHTYEYDGYGQLIADHFYDEANNEFFSTTYSYDSNGNITSVKKYPYYVLSGTPLEEMKYYYNPSFAVAFDKK